LPGLVEEEEEDYWVVRIPKPRRVLRVLRGFGSLPSRPITVDVPWVVITSLLISVLLFVFFTAVVKIPDVVSAVFTAIIVFVYLAVLRSEARR